MAEPKLTRSQRDKWAEELESGRWKQGRSALYDGEHYCCLGVLCAAVLGKELVLNDSGSEVIKNNPDYPHEVLTLEQIQRFVGYNDANCNLFRTIAKHVRALPVSEEEV
jgi:hypothetical protein